MYYRILMYIIPEVAYQLGVQSSEYPDTDRSLIEKLVKYQSGDLPYLELSDIEYAELKQAVLTATLWNYQ